MALRLPPHVLLSGTPAENARELPPESGALQMTLMISGLYSCVSKGTVPREKYSFVSYYYHFPVDGHLVRIANSIMTSDGRVIAWRMSRTKDGELLVTDLNKKNNQRCLDRSVADAA